jgi:hypothetical protein
MKYSDSTNSLGSPHSAAPQDMGFSPWQRLKSKRISYLALPLILMATVAEFIILSIGWKYQKTVCLPPGMGVTFFGIGPIGATILMVESLKLPLAAWTASRTGWRKGFMLIVGLPLICVLTFQLVKDMAVYEMGVAMTPASQMLEKATDEETKIAQLKSDLADIQAKKTDRQNALADLAARKAKAEADINDQLKHNDETRLDAISLTDYQKQQLAQVASRETTMIQQFDADADQINKAITDLRARREVAVAQASKWNAEEARIDNAYKAEMADYENKKAAYEKAEVEYENANFLKRELMKKPVDPGVPPVREDNPILKPAELAEIDSEINAKEAELHTVNNNRRDSVAQVEADARQLREQFDTRSSTKRDEADRKRNELLAAQVTLETNTAAQEKQIDQEYADAAAKVDGIQAQIDAYSKQAEADYEEREADIKKTQVYRIATTVEIIRGLIMGQHPVTIKATAKERGDLYTDQISMVRIWVYPVLAFIVAFLPTLMVEIGFSTLFMPEKKRPAYRLGFLGRRLHWLYTRAGRLKILRAERIANEASAEITARDRALAEKEVELQAARDAMGAAAAEHEEQLQAKASEWVAKLAGLTDSLNRTIIEKDALRDLQKSEIERQIQMRQNAWSDRLTQLRQELDDQRSAAETERMALMAENHKKMMEVSEDCKTQVIQVRRQMADAELAAVEKSAKMAHDLKEALHARDTVAAQLEHQANSFSVQLTQAREDAAREMEKAARQEKHRLERQQLEFEKTLRQRDEDFEHRLKQREQELSLAFDSRLAEEKSKVEQDARRRETELERRFEGRAMEVDARWNQQAQQQDEIFQIKMRQREQQLQSQFDARQAEVKAKWDQDLHNREQEWERNAEAGARAIESRLMTEMQQKEELFQSKLRQRDQQWQAKLDNVRVELQAQTEQELRRREAESSEARLRALNELETQLRAEMHEKHDVVHAESKQREQDLVTEMAAQTEARQLAEKERDEARQSAVEAARQVQDLKNKLMEVSSLLTGWKGGNGNGKHLATVGTVRNGF